MESGVNRRRGNPRSRYQGLAPMVLIGVGTVLLVGSIFTGIILAQKTHQSLRENLIADLYAAETQLMRMASPKTKKKISLPGTSTVECMVATDPADRPGEFANGVLTIVVRHDLAPFASAIFMDLVQAKWFDGVYIFRVIDGFIAQWGIRHPELVQDDEEPVEIPHNIKDPVTQASLSNTKGTLSFAAGNPFTKQVFVNIGDNSEDLDHETSRPFATVDEDGMKVIRKLYAGYKEGSGQVKALDRGLGAIQEEFPYWSKIEHCKILSAYFEDPASNPDKE